MNKTLIVNKKEAVELLTYEDCIPTMEKTLTDIAKGHVIMLQRNIIHHKSGNALAIMPASITAQNITGSKITIFGSKAAHKAGTVQGIVPLFSTESGALVAIVDATGITVIRTAATSAAATDLLANKHAKTLAILGAGRQGKAHVQAICKVRNIEEIYVYSPNNSSSAEMAAYLNETLSVKAIHCESAEQAVVHADIVCTVSNAQEPILEGKWLKKGAHINAVGACSSKIRELDTNAMCKGRVFVDQMEACLRDAGDIIIPMELGEFLQSNIAGEIGNVYSGEIPGRTSENEITIFESVGLAVEDLAAAWLIYKKAVKNNRGVYVEI